jgi:hypothetical protein
MTCSEQTVSLSLQTVIMNSFQSLVLISVSLSADLHPSCTKKKSVKLR